MTLEDVPRAWAAAQRLDSRDEDLWTRLVKEYQTIDPAAVVPVLQGLIESDLQEADVRNYRSAVKRLRQLRRICTSMGQADSARAFIEQVREQHRNRPRFLRELDRANLLS